MFKHARWPSILGASVLCGIAVLPWAYYLGLNPWPFVATGVVYCAFWCLVYELRRVRNETTRKRRPTEADFRSGLYPF